MQLGATDETDLLIPLYGGVHDQALWRTFLARVMRRTAADHAALVLIEGDHPHRKVLVIFSGRDLAAEAQALGLEEGMEQLRQSYPRLRVGRVYQAAELLPADRPSNEVQEGFRRALGISDERVVRVAEVDGVSAWLTVARNRRSFSAADGALLATLAPHVAMALRGFVASERQRLSSAMAAAALDRAGTGWIAFGPDAKLLDIDPQLGPVLAGAVRADDGSVEQALLASPGSRQALTEAARAFAGNAEAPPRIAVLSKEPRIEALLMPAEADHGLSLKAPAMLALCRLPQRSGKGRRNLLGALFGLSAREAQLALLLGDGATIHGAAATMGIKEETARGYSKRIYAKMDVSGQAALVRRLFQSVAALA